MVPLMNAGSWRDRLALALEQGGLSARGVSLKAGMASGYVHSLLKEGKEPTVDNLLRVCQAAGVSGVQVIFGYPMTQEAEELVAIWSRSSQSRRQAILQILAEQRELES